MRNNRRVGQHLRNLKADGWTKLCISAMNRALGDVHAIARRLERGYQPGANTPLPKLVFERSNLVAWVETVAPSDSISQFDMWATYLGYNPEEKREQVLETLGG